MDSFGNKTFEPSTEVGIISDLREDLYVVYAGSIDGTERAHFTFLVNPLVPWFWIGGTILALGGIMAMWPGGPQVRTQRRRSVVQAGYTVPLAEVAE
jgi:cytochrome c biogenesis factor